MIKLFLGILAVTGAITFTSAQNSSGSITYENKINLHRRLAEGQESLKAMMPEYRVTRNELLFDTSSTLYKPIIEEEEESFGSGGMSVRLKMPQSEFYLDIPTRTLTRLQEFMGKNYLMEGSVTIQPWKMGAETIEVMGYTCQMAYFTDTTTNMEVTAWYTMDLPPFMGPETYNTLPGTVLALDINNGERVIVARKVELRALKNDELKKPEKGEAITQEEYNLMVKDQTEKMKKSRGMMIRH